MITAHKWDFLALLLPVQRAQLPIQMTLFVVKPVVTVQIPPDNAGIYGMLQRQIVPMDMWLIKPSGGIRGAFSSWSTFSCLASLLPNSHRCYLQPIGLENASTHVSCTKLEHFGHSIGPSDICQADFVQLCATGRRSEGYKDSRMKVFCISLKENRIKQVESTCCTILYSARYLLKMKTG